MDKPIGSFGKRVLSFYGFLGGINISAWLWAFIAFRDRPILLGTALIAYTFGLRHAVDADHIAAIDNATRKLMQEGKRPIGVGFYFSLGHSTVVLLASLVAYLAASVLQSRFSAFQEVGSFIGTSMSAIFLFGIALANVFVLSSVYRTFRKAREGQVSDHGDMEVLFGQGGGVGARILRPLFKLLSQSWHMYPVGFLFGLGFDTATEVAILGLSAAAASKGLPLGSMMVFPVLFTAGMTLVDTTDCILMIGAYGWAFVKPIRKLYYNLTLTFVSVVIALAVGGVEVIGLIREKLRLNGGAWDFIGNLSNNFGNTGFLVIGVFILGWIGSMLLYRLKGFDRLADKCGLRNAECGLKSERPELEADSASGANSEVMTPPLNNDSSGNTGAVFSVAATVQPKTSSHPI
jgi:nickel/cobalt transporter (NiCoT) family protein